MTVADKSGQKAEKFYVRDGNASKELSISAANEYIGERFENA